MQDEATKIISQVRNWLETFVIGMNHSATTLLIHPNSLLDFDDYNQFFGLVDDLLQHTHFIGEFQVASFHPDYQFADTEKNAAENYTNRSPYPMLHILREADVAKAIANYPSVNEIPNRNIKKMNLLGADKLQTLLSNQCP